MTDPVRKTHDNGENTIHSSHDDISPEGFRDNGADLQITIQKPSADLVIITLKGSVMNVDNYYKLHKIIYRFLDDRVYKIIVDLSDLKYMTSVGAGIFINAGMVTQEHKGALVLVNPQPRVKAILDLLGLTETCEICRLVNYLEDAFEVLGISQEQFRKLERKIREEQKRLQGMKGGEET